MRCRELSSKTLKVFIIQALTDNYVYLLQSPHNPGFVVIDPSETEPVLHFLNRHNGSVAWILNTHHHHDHVGGNLELKERFHCQIMCSEYDQPRIPAAEHAFKKGEQIIHGLNIRAIPVPGHTLGHTALYLGDHNLLVAGDTLFSLGCGRLFEGTHEQLFESLQRLKSLPPQTLVLCGHEYTAKNSQFTLAHSPASEHRKEVQRRTEEVAAALQNNEIPLPTTLGWEIENNLFLRAKSLEEFRALRIARDHLIA